MGVGFLLRLDLECASPGYADFALLASTIARFQKLAFSGASLSPISPN